jgi:hypothetical protein
MVATLRVRADPCCVAPGTLTSSDSITFRPSASTRPKVSPRDRVQGSALGLTSLSFPAYRGHARTFLKSLEALRPSAIIDIIKSGEDLVLSEGTRQKLKGQQTCLRCGYMASNELCVRRKDLAPARRGKEGLTKCPRSHRKLARCSSRSRLGSKPRRWRQPRVVRLPIRSRCLRHLHGRTGRSLSTIVGSASDQRRQSKSRRSRRERRRRRRRPMVEDDGWPSSRLGRTRCTSIGERHIQPVRQLPHAPSLIHSPPYSSYSARVTPIWRNSSVWL